MVVSILFCVLLCAFVIRYFYFQRLKLRSQISFKESLDLAEAPIVTFYSGKTKLNFLLDTGSSDSFINKSMLPFLDYGSTSDIVEIITGHGTTTAELVQLSIQYKSLTFTGMFGAIDLDDEFSQIKAQSGITIHGILGTNVFKDWNYVLDFRDCIAYCV